MRRTNSIIAILIIAALSVSPLIGAKADPLEDILKGIVKAAEQAAREKAYKKWAALPRPVLDCVIRIYRIDVNGLIQRGIGPDHKQVKPYVERCQAAVAEAQRQENERIAREREAALAAERERQRIVEEERERQRIAEERLEREREAERQAVNKFKSDVRGGRKGYGVMAHLGGGSGICLEEGADADVIVFAINRGRVALAVPFMATGQISRGEAGTMVAQFQRNFCALLIASSRGLEAAVQLLELNQLQAKPVSYWIDPAQIAQWRRELAEAQAAEAERLRKLKEEQLLLERRRQACLSDAKKAGYFAQVCKVEAFQLSGRFDLARSAETSERALRGKLTLCTDDDLVEVRAKARAAASQILSSGAVGPLADVKSAVEIECTRANAR